jgi:hypothetical protein
LKGEQIMSEFLESIERSVDYLRKRYAADLPLLIDLEKKLDYLKTRKKKSSQDKPFAVNEAD